MQHVRLVRHYDFVPFFSSHSPSFRRSSHLAGVHFSRDLTIVSEIRKAVIPLQWLATLLRDPYLG